MVPSLIRSLYFQAPIVTAYADGYGAKQPMVVDFWRMILQERASTIVMLAQIGDMTKTGESVPIHVYWPMEKDDTMTDLDGISVKNLGVSRLSRVCSKVGCL